MTFRKPATFRIASLCALALLLAGAAKPQGVQGQSDARASAETSAVSVEQLLERASLAVAGGRLGEAAALLAAVPDDSALALEAAFELGRVRVLERRYVEAEALLRSAVAAGVGAATARLYLSASLWENGKAQEAEALLRDSMGGGGDSQIRYQLARLLLWQGRYEEAHELLRALAVIYASRLDLQLDSARALEGSGDYASALGAYLRCRELAPEHYEIRYGLARVLQRLGRSEEAAAELAAYRTLLNADQALSREQGRGQANIDLAVSRWMAGESDQALASLAAMPATVDVLLAIARIEQAAGGTVEAIAALERAASLAPERSDIRLRLDELVQAASEPQ